MLISSNKDLSKGTALKFVILLSVVSLFADMTYEGARSITGPFLGLLGANAAIVGFVAGFGELIGYALRILSGYLADKTGKYWTITIVGYVCNLLAVPMLALVGVAIWSIGVSAHESLMRAIVANMVPKNKRASAYGIFNTGFGFFWFLGSFLMGILYDISIPALVIFSMAIQLMAVPLLMIVMKKIKFN